MQQFPAVLASHDLTPGGPIDTSTYPSAIAVTGAMRLSATWCKTLQRVDSEYTMGFGGRVFVCAPQQYHLYSL